MEKQVKTNSLKGIAVILAAMIIGGSISVMTYAAVTKKNTDSDTTTEATASETDKGGEKVTKDETVYVLANADGSVKKIIVSDWIKNKTGAATVNDSGELKDVKNVKGDTSYTMNSDNMRVWNADGEDICTQGISEQTLPVDLSVTYSLDGKNITAKELAGKSGKVTMRFDYKNNQYEYTEIDGKKEKIYVPFVMLTGMLLNNDNFKNVEVTNGKIIGDGDRTAVVGFALPGLQENLAISTEKFEIPSYVEITADVTDFELETTMTLATNNVFNELDLNNVTGIDNLKEKMTTLTDSMQMLLDGSSWLYNGLNTLLGKSAELIDGIDKLNDAAGQLSAGAKKVADGAAAADNGVTEVSNGLKLLTANNQQLGDGLNQLTNTFLSQTTQQLTEKVITIETLTAANYKTVLGGLLTNPDDTQKQQLIAIANYTLENELASKNIPAQYYAAVKYMLCVSISEKVAAGSSIEDAQNAAMTEVATALATNPQKIGEAAAAAATPEGQTAIAQFCLMLAQNTLKSSLTSAISALDLCTGLQTYIATVQTISDSVSGKLAVGTAELKSGSAELSDGANKLAGGVRELKSNTPALADGVKQLKDGSMQLSDGLKQFNEEGVKKLVDAVNGDLGGIVARLKATVDVSKDYKSFTGIDDGQDGNVKFIYKTDAIEK